MALCEIAFKVRDGDREGFRHGKGDGMPISIKPPGVALTARAYSRWALEGRIPDALQGKLGPSEYAEHERTARRVGICVKGITVEELARLRRLTIVADGEEDHGGRPRRFATVREAVDAWLESRIDGAELDRELALVDNPRHAPMRPQRVTRRYVQDIIDGAISVMDSVLAHGYYDTAWGFCDLKIYGVLLADLDFRQAAELVSEPTDRAADPCDVRWTWAARRWRLNYQAILSDRTIAGLLTEGQVVHVPRGQAQPLSWGDLLDRALVHGPEPAAVATSVRYWTDRCRLSTARR